MARTPPRAKRQHYVAKSYLELFGVRAGSEYRLHVYDLKEARRFATSAYRIAKEFGFYDTSFRGRKDSLESWLGEIESQGAPALRRLHESRSVRGLRAKDRLRLAQFVASLAVRGPYARSEIGSLPALLFKHLAARGHQPDDRLVVGLRSDREETVAIHNAVIKDITATAPRLASMSMRLYSPPQGREFCTSDNPVLRYNPVDAGPRGNLGLFSPGIQIIVPLSSDLLLSIVDPAYGGEGSAVERFTPDNLLF